MYFHSKGNNVGQYVVEFFYFTVLDILLVLLLEFDFLAYSHILARQKFYL